MRYLYTVLTFVLALSASAIVLQPGPGVGKDTYISSSSANTNYGNLDYMYVGRSGGTLLQSLIQFVELDNYIGDSVTSSTLSLYFIVDEGSATNVTLYMDRITEDWIDQGGGGVTWNTKPGVAETPESYAYPTSTNGAWVDYDVTELVNYWLDGTYNNYGWLIYTDSNLPHNAYADTCEYSEPTYRPKLELLGLPVESTSLGEIKAAFK